MISAEMQYVGQIQNKLLTVNLLTTIADQPVLTLKLGSNLDLRTIKERDDVYFECDIDSNPPVTTVGWHHNVSPATLRQTFANILV